MKKGLTFFSYTSDKKNKRLFTVGDYKNQNSAKLQSIKMSHIFGPSPFFGTPLELVRLQKHLSCLSMQLGWRHLWRTPPQSHRPGPTKLESRRHHPSTHRKPFISGFFNISGKSFYGTLPNELWQLQRLRIVDLSSDIIPVSLPDDTSGDCIVLRRLSFSFNKIRGWIPQKIGNLAELAELYLDGNNLQAGLIPSVIFNSSNIQVIILYGNHLSGHLRSSIYLPNLETLFL
ncbi:hypothetical protein CUMW_009100 [Citrus unshiu]|nr:hypothetical protein CUMW_009100 [Citrus unshiu]